METKYNVILYDINSKELEEYDVIPYFVREYEWTLKNANKYTKVPETDEEFREFVKRKAQYNFWSRCEYEIVVTGFPNNEKKHKIDAYYQIMSNFGIVVSVFKNKLKELGYDI